MLWVAQPDLKEETVITMMPGVGWTPNAKLAGLLKSNLEKTQALP
jgi:hypothetical protein